MLVWKNLLNKWYFFRTNNDATLSGSGGYARYSISERRFPASHSIEVVEKTIDGSISERRFPASHSKKGG